HELVRKLLHRSLLAVERADVVVRKYRPRRDHQAGDAHVGNGVEHVRMMVALTQGNQQFKVPRVTSRCDAVLIEPVDDRRQLSWFESRSAQPSITASTGTTERGLGMSACDQWDTLDGNGFDRDVLERIEFALVTNDVPAPQQLQDVQHLIGASTPAIEPLSDKIELFSHPPDTEAEDDPTAGNRRRGGDRLCNIHWVTQRKDEDVMAKW